MKKQDLRQIISEANKRRWALVPKEVRVKKMSDMGKIGGKAHWEKLTPEEQRLKVFKMNEARKLKSQARERRFLKNGA